MSVFIPTIEDVREAAGRVTGKAIRTPLLRSDFLDGFVDAKVFIKPECLQRTGSFKFRGACNALAAMPKEMRDKGVIAVSSGNHAQGIAEAAALFGVPATIIMPKDAPKTKAERTRRSGAEVIYYDRLHEDRDEAAEQHIERTGAAFVHPFNNPYVIAGQGTAGLEIVEDMKGKGISPDHMLICTGGGGLTAGVSLAIKDGFPDCLIHTCEPEGFDDYRRSLESGRLESNATQGGSICDAIVTPKPGEIGFEINRQLVSDGLVISDDEALLAVAFAYRELKLVVEPGGVAALASLLKYRKRFAGQTVALTLSGGNMDPEMLNQALDLYADKGSYV